VGVNIFVPFEETGQRLVDRAIQVGSARRTPRSNKTGREGTRQFSMKSPDEVAHASLHKALIRHNQGTAQISWPFSTPARYNAEPRGRLSRSRDRDQKNIKGLTMGSKIWRRPRRPRGVPLPSMFTRRRTPGHLSDRRRGIVRVVYSPRRARCSHCHGRFYRSQDSGVSWQPIYSGFSNAAWDLAVDPADSSRVYVIAPNSAIALRQHRRRQYVGTLGDLSLPQSPTPRRLP